MISNTGWMACCEAMRTWCSHSRWTLAMPGTLGAARIPPVAGWTAWRGRTCKTCRYSGNKSLPTYGQNMGKYEIQIVIEYLP